MRNHGVFFRTFTDGSKNQKKRLKKKAGNTPASRVGNLPIVFASCPWMAREYIFAIACENYPRCAVEIYTTFGTGGGQ
jgi:hypothetical protein